jgi:hypothetical protein
MAETADALNGVREKSTEVVEDHSSDERLSMKITTSMRKASGIFRIKSERQIGRRSVSEKNVLGDKNSSPKRALQSDRNLVSEPSFSNGSSDNNGNNEPVDDEQKSSPALSKLPSSGFNRLKGLWANKEISAGFSSPLATWSRPYGSYSKKNAPAVDVKVKGKFDPDHINGQVFINFGHNIPDCPRTQLANYKERIPSVLILLRDELEKHSGFIVEGVFRVAASFDDQKAIKIKVDDGTFEGCKCQDDAMCMAALLKEWFRTMPMRLLNALPTSAVREGKADIENDLPEPNLSVFMWLCDLMADIVKLEQINRMSPRAMAIVIAPNLYSAAVDASPQEMMQEMNGVVTIVEAALRECIARRKADETVENAAE